jgi:hypothetical protein
MGWGWEYRTEVGHSMNQTKDVGHGAGADGTATHTNPTAAAVASASTLAFEARVAEAHRRVAEIARVRKQTLQSMADASRENVSILNDACDGHPADSRGGRGDSGGGGSSGGGGGGSSGGGGDDTSKSEEAHAAVDGGDGVSGDDVDSGVGEPATGHHHHHHHVTWADESSTGVPLTSSGPSPPPLSPAPPWFEVKRAPSCFDVQRVDVTSIDPTTFYSEYASTPVILTGCKLPMHFTVEFMARQYGDKVRCSRCVCVCATRARVCALYLDGGSHTFV